MTLAALLLVLAAAGLHAWWNLLAKRAGTAGGAGGAAFVWLVNLVATVCYAPLIGALAVAQQPRVGLVELGAFAGSGVLQLAYFLLLQRAYRAGDLSLVYPLARGSGPVLATACAIVFLGERPTPVALAGGGLIVAGVALLLGDPRDWRGARERAGAGASAETATAVRLALLTGACIAGYTLWDRHAVAVLRIPPPLMHWAALAVQAALLTPLAWRRRAQVRAAWSGHRPAVIGVALLSPLAYLLVLTALTFTPVSYVAPGREVSILFGTLVGARVLREAAAPRRTAAGAMMVAGLVALALG